MQSEILGEAIRLRAEGTPFALATVVVVGASAVSQALARLASILDFEVWPATGCRHGPVSRREPAGWHSRCAKPAEIAFSMMAELLEICRQRVGHSMDQPPAPRQQAVDPICGMTVDVATATYRSERNGQTYYFCCAGCQARFEAT